MSLKIQVQIPSGKQLSWSDYHLPERKSAGTLFSGYFKREARSNEAALKYFILGALSSGILLYGISLLYGVAGTVQLADLSEALRAHPGNPLVPLGWILLAAGLFFKVAAVPFHVWTPDVYVGAPTPVTAYLSVASKAASFAILLRIFYEGLGSLHAEWQTLVATPVREARGTGVFKRWILVPEQVSWTRQGTRPRVALCHTVDLYRHKLPLFGAFETWNLSCCPRNGWNLSWQAPTATAHGTLGAIVTFAARIASLNQSLPSAI